MYYCNNKKTKIKYVLELCKLCWHKKQNKRQGHGGVSEISIHQ